MTTIAFDTWALSSRFRNHGTYCYAMNVLRNLPGAISEADVNVRYFVSPGSANDAKQLDGGPHSQPVETSLLRLDRLWRLGLANVAASRTGADLLFSPSPHIIPMGTVPVVTTIHDATLITSSSLASWKNASSRFLTAAAARLSKHIVTVSNWSKKDIVEIYGVPPEKVTVVYEAFDHGVFNSSPGHAEKLSEILDKHGIVAPYLLHHGALQPRKNLVRLIQAYRLLLDRHSGLDLQLVLAGPLGWRYEDILRAANENGGRGKVVMTGLLPAERLAELVKGAAACVIPSLYEGFCLPMIECMACGVPTIVSNASCLPEISGGVLHYFDPNSVEDIARAIWDVLDNPSLQAQLIGKGRERSAHFSWRRCAEETLEVLLRTVQASERHAFETQSAR